VSVVISDSVHEVDEVLALVHDGFVEAGFLAPRPSGRRLIPAYLNPGTTFVLAQMQGRSVAAGALVPDGPFGLPSDRAFVEEIDAIRAEDVPVVECGSLTVAASERRHTRHLFGRIMGALVRLIGERGPDATVVISVTPEAARFYAGLFGLTVVSEPRPLYGEPAVLLRAAHRDMANALASSTGAHGRQLASFALGPRGSWLMDRRTGEAWPSEWLRPLLEEAGVMGRLRGQLGAVESAAASVPQGKVRGLVAA
jgi:hypothetical protein